MTQDRALEIMSRGDNVMLTGPAGAGKSYLLSRFIKECKRKRKKVVVTATTGLAAAHLGGQTIHSWTGMGIGESLHPDYIYTMSEARKKAIRKTKVLIIDEVSMMHDYNLNMVDQAMRIVRESVKPFGGLQVILTGDFFQLPPVMHGGSGKFITESSAWNEAKLSVCYLEEQHRADDLRLQEILNSLREGSVQQKHIDWLYSRMGKTAPEKVTRLYTTNIDVENINNEKLAMINEDTHYYLRTSNAKSAYDIMILQRNVLAPEKLMLKKGAVVMAVKNDPLQRYVNGSTGIVKDFDSRGLPLVDFGSKEIVIEPEDWEYRKNDRLVASITQVPLRLAYAITVHKSQGMTLDGAEIDLTKAFVEGMGYVALSRVKSLNSLYLQGLNQMSLQVSRVAREIDKKLREESRKIA